MSGATAEHVIADQEWRLATPLMRSASGAETSSSATTTAAAVALASRGGRGVCLS